MKILIIDDSEAEISRAIEAAKSRGVDYEIWQPGKWMEYGRKDFRDIMDGGAVDGVVTDLFWDYFYFADRGPDPNPNAASGLLVAMHGLRKQIPVVICTNEFHHGKKISWICDGYLSHSGDKPFGIVDTKNWSEAIRRLIERMVWR